MAFQKDLCSHQTAEKRGSGRFLAGSPWKKPDFPGFGPYFARVPRFFRRTGVLGTSHFSIS